MISKIICQQKDKVPWRWFLDQLITGDLLQQRPVSMIPAIINGSGYTSGYGFRADSEPLCQLRIEIFRSSIDSLPVQSYLYNGF